MTNRRLWSIFRHRHVKWLIFCILLGALAVIVWPGAAVHESDIFVPVKFRKIPAGLIITGPHVKGIEVRAQGPKSAMKALAQLKLQYFLDLSNINAGVKTIPIDQDRITLPRGISIIKVNPAFLTVRVAKEIKKELPVSLSFSGKPASGFTVTGAVAKPLSFHLRGPENILGPMVKIMTKPIDIKGLSESFKKEIALDLAEDLVNISASKVVLVEIFIEEKIVTRSYQDIPVIGKDTPYTYTVTKGLKPGVYVRRAAINLPVKSTLIGAEPEVFTVKLYSP